MAGCGQEQSRKEVMRRLEVLLLDNCSSS